MGPPLKDDGGPAATAPAFLPSDADPATAPLLMGDPLPAPPIAPARLSLFIAGEPEPEARLRDDALPILDAGEAALSGGGDRVLASDDAVGANSREADADTDVDVGPDGDCLDALDAGRREGVVDEARGVEMADDATRGG